MANEGEFPKVDGDVLYASEANNLHRFSVYGIGTSDAITSGTALQTMGSVLIPAGSLTNPCHIIVTGGVNGTANDAIIIETSGTSANNSLTIGAGITNAIVNPFKYNLLVGSPYNGMAAVNLDRGNSSNSDGTSSRISNSAFNNLDTGSPVVIKFQANAKGTLKTIYSVVAYNS